MNDNEKTEAQATFSLELRQLNFALHLRREQMSRGDSEDEEFDAEWHNSSMEYIADLEAKISCLTPDAPLRMYTVTNRANSVQYVVAKSRTCAALFSAETGHIRSVKNATISYVDIAALRAKDPGAAKALEDARAAELPGTLKNRNGQWVRSRLGV